MPPPLERSERKLLLLALLGTVTAAALVIAVVAYWAGRGKDERTVADRAPEEQLTPDTPPEPEPAPDTGPEPEPEPGPLASASEIERAVARAEPGDDLVIAEGTYRLSLDINRVSGTAEQPIRLRAEPGAVVRIVSGDDPYALFVRNAAHWEIGSEDGRLEFDGDGTARATVGIGLYSGTIDETSNDDPGPAEHITLRNVGISRSGQGLLRIGHGSRDIDVVDSQLSGSGLRRPDFGEGVYIGSAEGLDEVRWIRLTDVRIDDVRAEAVDVKPGASDVILDRLRIEDVHLRSIETYNKCAIAHRGDALLRITETRVSDVRTGDDASQRRNAACGIYVDGPVLIQDTVVEDTEREAVWVNNATAGITVTVIDSRFRRNGGDPHGINHSGEPVEWTIVGDGLGTLSSSIPVPEAIGETPVR